MKHEIMKRKMWTKEDTDFLIKNYENMTTTQIANKLGYTIRSVRRKCHKLGLVKDKFKWTPQDEQFIKDNFNKLTIYEMSNILGCSYDTVRHKLNTYKLYKTRSRTYTLYNKEVTSQEVNEFIRNNYKNMSVNELAEALNTTNSIIYNRMFHLNLSCNRIKHKGKRGKLTTESIFNKYDTNILYAIIDKLIYEYNINDLDTLKSHLTEDFLNKISTILLIKDILQIQDEIIHLYSYKLEYKCILNHNEFNIEKYFDRKHIFYTAQTKIPSTSYTVDFLLKGKIIIEIYGDFWHGNLTQFNSLSKTQKDKIRKDINRLNELSKLGYQTLIIWESDIINHLSFVYKHIDNWIKYFNLK